MWLQAQVSELEYGIRALTELYTHLRQGKVTRFGLFFFFLQFYFNNAAFPDFNSVNTCP